ncbi:MAG: hypothetical protein IJK98_04370, partial [Clostridia bacterium]|nr:hypothetical protein [Clostridia bacterium]
MKRFLSLLCVAALLLTMPIAVPVTQAAFDDDHQIVDDTLSVQQKADLLNQAELSPVTTGYEPLDSLVESIFSRIFTDDMDMFQKVCACFSFLMQGGT